MRIDSTQQGNNYYPPDSIAAKIIAILSKKNISSQDIKEIQRLSAQLNQGSFGTAGDTISLSVVQSFINRLDPNNINYSDLANVQGAFLGVSYIDAGHTDTGEVYLITNIMEAAQDFSKAPPSQQSELEAYMSDNLEQLKSSGVISKADLNKLNGYIQDLPGSAKEIAQFASYLRNKYFSSPS